MNDRIKKKTKTGLKVFDFEYSQTLCFAIGYLNGVKIAIDQSITDINDYNKFKESVIKEHL